MGGLLGLGISLFSFLLLLRDGCDADEDSDHIEGVNALLEKRKPNFNSTVDDAPAVYQYWSDANVDNVKIAKKFSKL